MLLDIPYLKNYIVGSILNPINLYEDPFKFMPERWMKIDEGKNKDSFSFSPFSGGPRNCIGNLSR